MSSSSERQSARTPLERVLGLFTEVRPGESAGALLLTLNVFLLLAAYYVMKPVREGLILELKGGAELKSWMSAVMTVLLVFLVPAYSSFANRVKRNRLVVSVTLFFASHLLLFWLGSSSAWIRERMGLVFFVWIGIFNMMAVAQFWAFSNDQYTEEQGKRLFALVGLGASLGSVAGSKLSAMLLPAIGLYPNLLVAGGMLAACAGLTQLAYAVNRPIREAAERAATAQEEAEDSGAGGEEEPKADARGGFSLVLSSRYLTLIAFFSLAFSMANTNGEYMLGSLFSKSAKALASAGEIPADQVGRHIGALYADFFFWVNLIGVTLQAFVVSRLVKYGGVRAALLTVPIVALTSGIAIALFPVLAVVRIGKTAENASDYSINNTARQLLWLPTSADVKYKAKQAVDTFFVRSGDVLSGLLVLVLVTWLAAPLRAFAICNLVVVMLWLGLALAITRESKKLRVAERADEETGT
ncbi:MAG: MFS transporter [Myxococcales bacterium]|nr:MFS transporter [Myxococcales bacterium]